LRTSAYPARLVQILPAFLLALVLSAQGQRELVTFDDAKAILLAAMLDNTTWPNEEAIDHFILGLYGEDEALLVALNNGVSGTKVRGKPVVVNVYETLAAARAAHVLVLPASENDNLEEIDRELRQSQTLIVTDAAGDKTNIMVNFTYPSKVRLGFEINASNIIYAGLNLSREMLMFGGSKLDLAAVYEESEAKLVRAKAIAIEQQRQLEEQQKLLSEQSATIERQRAEVAANRQELSGLELQLAGIQQTLDESESRLSENAAQLEEKEKVLAEKEAHIESYSERIERNLQRLDAQQEAISAQERQIEEQSSVLVKQLGTIEVQRFILVTTVAVLLLVLALIVLIFRGYRSKHRLALQLEGKTLELGVANEKLVEVTEAKSRFLSTMSHEIRTPMNGVLGMAELLEGTDLTRQQREYLSLIIKSGDTLLGLINDILDFSKIEAGRLDLEHIPFTLRDVLGDTLQTLALRANEKGLELTFHIPPDVPDRLIGDPLRIRQVMVNLVGNAIKFTDTGEVAVDLRLESCDDEGVRVYFEVRDTGIGISEVQKQKIFEAFGQADSSTTRQFGGTGLGLAIAVQLVQMMGGRLAVRSEMGHGSTFYFSADFRLPAEPTPLALKPEELRGLRALVVDDNSTNRMILEELLDNWGMSACVVAGGEEALEELERAESAGRPFAVALLDVMMPHMDGFELAARIRQRPAQQAMRILMLTSAGRSNTEGTRVRLDISRILLKPTKHSDLQSAITDALGVTSGVLDETSRVTPADLAPRKILLVEDNPVNQKVAVELLGKRGHRVEVATNGEEAVAAVAAQSFDVVLMDVHMPVMDGLTATRIIREREHDSGSHLPIVALTAGATVEDRENCLTAGMSNFVTKPFRAQELFAAVEGVAAEVLAEEVQEESAQSPKSPADEPCLDWQGALRNLEGDEEFLLELVEMFLDQYPAMLAAVEEAVSGEEGDELKRAAHSLKGSSQVIGGRATAAVALQLESMGRSGNFTEVLPALRSLQENLAELKVALIAELPVRET
jgi:signal transduction histidine kinase/CheY-like chemotaxis protein/HPt (histidine-containing phosphotransfer) domain-containing protein